MSTRKPEYLIRVILLAMLMSLPHAIVCIQLAQWAIGNRLFAVMKIPGLGETHDYGNTLTWAPFWHDQFIYHANAIYDGSPDWRFAAIDPESGRSNELAFRWRGPGGSLPRVYGDRLFLASHYFENRASAEVVDGRAKESNYVDPRFSLPQGQLFLLNGEPARVEYFVRRFVVSTIRTGTWTKTESVILPDTDRDWTIGSSRINFQRVTQMKCFNHGNQIHVFLNVDGALVYRSGLDLKPFVATDASLPNSNSTQADSTTAPASAMNVQNSVAQIAGWSLVRNPNESADSSTVTQTTIPVDGGMLVEGQPTALTVDQTQPGDSVGSIYRFDGAQWSLFASQRFPFGSNRFRTVVCDNGQRSYIVATTSLGSGHVYVVDANGIRHTDGAAAPPYWGPKHLTGILWIPVITLVCGIVLGVGTWVLMFSFTKPEYECGLYAVKLASLARRGLARIIDLALVTFSTAGLGWILTRGFDWLSLAEAMNLHVDHPTIRVATRILALLGLWVAVVVLTLVSFQGRSGLTPGKWFCGLRTVRTTLKPCGFARSLAREVVMCVDSGNLLWWTPGILCIAFTNCRQRLGDLVAETIVVEQRSLLRCAIRR